MRSLSTTARRSNMLSWFRTKKQEMKKVVVQDTKSVMSDIESNGVQVKESSDKLTMKLIPENFIGTAIGVKEKYTGEVVFNKWLGDKANPKDLDTIVNDSLIDGMAVEDTFADLKNKFDFTKNFQAKSGYMIPDYKITVLQTPLQFKEYLSNELDTEKKKLHYSSRNINVIQSVKGRDQKKTYNKIINDLNMLNAHKNENILREL